MRSTLVAAAMALVIAGAPSAGADSPAPRSDAACSRPETTKIIRSFIRALNRSDISTADGLWAQEADFQWYFVDDEREQDAEDRTTLPSYFAARAGLNDHMQLRRLRVSSDGTDFAFQLRRTSDDDRAGAAGLFHGKGAAGDSLALPTIAEPIPTRTCLLTVWAMDNHRD